MTDFDDAIHRAHVRQMAQARATRASLIIPILLGCGLLTGFVLAGWVLS